MFFLQLPKKYLTNSTTSVQLNGFSAFILSPIDIAYFLLQIAKPPTLIHKNENRIFTDRYKYNMQVLKSRR